MNEKEFSDNPANMAFITLSLRLLWECLDKCKQNPDDEGGLIISQKYIMEELISMTSMDSELPEDLFLDITRHHLMQTMKSFSSLILSKIGERSPLEETFLKSVVAETKEDEISDEEKL